MEVSSLRRLMRARYFIASGLSSSLVESKRSHDLDLRLKYIITDLIAGEHCPVVVGNL